MHLILRKRKSFFSEDFVEYKTLFKSETYTFLVNGDPLELGKKVGSGNHAAYDKSIQKGMNIFSTKYSHVRYQMKGLD